MAVSPPAGWDEERRREYFDWARAVVDGLREPNAALLKEFEELWAMRPGR